MWWCWGGNAEAGRTKKWRAGALPKFSRAESSTARLHNSDTRRVKFATDSSLPLVPSAVMTTN